MSKPSKKMSLDKRNNLTGWAFLTPAALLILVMSFVPMVKAFILSFQTGVGAAMKPCGISNYTRMFKDTVFMQSVKNTFFYLIIQVPIMLILALILASILNNRNLRFKGLFRTMIFLPCATSLVAYATIFRTLFANNGIINLFLVKIGILDAPYSFLTHPISAKIVIILGLLWRWTGYNMVFYLAGLQNIEYSVYEAAKIDGANGWKTFWKTESTQSALDHREWAESILLWEFTLRIQQDIHLQSELLLMLDAGHTDVDTLYLIRTLTTQSQHIRG